MEIVWDTGGGDVGAVQVDASVREVHEAAAKATDLAVERGANVSDHVRAQSPQITIEGQVSNTPIAPPSTQMDGATGATEQMSIDVPELGELREGRNSVGGGTAGLGRRAGPRTVVANVLSWSARFDRVRSVYDVITKLLETGTLVKIVTGLRVYDSMVLESFEVERTAETGNALAFTMSAKRVRIVNSELVNLPEPTEPRGRARSIRGRIEAAIVDAQMRAAIMRADSQIPRRSTVAAILDSL